MYMCYIDGPTSMFGGSLRASCASLGADQQSIVITGCSSSSSSSVIYMCQM